MKYTKSVLIGAVMLTAVTTTNATTIDLGPPGIFTERVLNFFGLEGVPLAGQSLNLDFNFSNNEFIRVYSTSRWTDFVSLLALQTSATTFPGTLAGNGYVTDSNGQQYSSLVGSAMGDNGLTTMALFPFWDDLGPIPGIATPLDIYGIHYNITLPTTPGIEIVSSQLRISGLEIPNREGRWLPGDNFSSIGVGPGIPDQIPPVPDTGSTILLLLGSLIPLFLLRKQITNQETKNAVYI